MTERLDVVSVRFDYMDRTDAKMRPAVVLSSWQFNQSRGYFVLTPLTGSAGNFENDDAVEIQDIDLAGLNRRSYSCDVLANANNRDLRPIVGNLAGRRFMQMIFNAEVVARDVGYRWPPHTGNTATGCRS